MKRCFDQCFEVLKGWAHSRTDNVVKSLSDGCLLIGVPAPESKLGLCGTRTQTDGTGAICGFTVVMVVVLLFIVVLTKLIY